MAAFCLVPIWRELPVDNRTGSHVSRSLQYALPKHALDQEVLFFAKGEK